jgi:A/G-specific adenine glycosylase
MLQQTQVSRVLPKYEEFLSLFPDVFSLANASIADVLKAWKGMGYNRRALYLKKLAENISAEYSGIFPKDEKRLLSLPGLGALTPDLIIVEAVGSIGAIVRDKCKILCTNNVAGTVLGDSSATLSRR